MPSDDQIRRAQFVPWVAVVLIVVVGVVLALAASALLEHFPVVP